jgi:hypothetical protein
LLAFFGGVQFPAPDCPNAVAAAIKKLIKIILFMSGVLKVTDWCYINITLSAIGYFVPLVILCLF